MSPRLDWEKLLSDRRPKSASKKDAPAKADAPTQPSLPAMDADVDARGEFERDYDRLVFSAPFRRLAGKTQVHPFAAIDHVHNRLTHSFEVASVGRSLATAAARFVKKHGDLPVHRSAEDFSYIVQAACLAHDIGNPPFGHAGEYAIREWTRINAAKIFGADTADAVPPELRGLFTDWTTFEGNAQAFRMVTRGDNDTGVYFRLTYATLGAMVKYPWHSADPRALLKDKYNVFSSDLPAFADFAEATGLRRADGTVARHPLSFLSEVADDICYRIADFEDAVDMGILPQEEVSEIFARIAGEEGRINGRNLPHLRSMALSALTKAAVSAFAQNYDLIMAGEREADLKSDFPEPIKLVLIDIKKRYEDIFGHKTKLATEIGAYNTLGRIIGFYAQAVGEMSRVRDFEKLGYIYKRCLELAWGRDYAKANQTQPYAWWLARVMDFVSGMTDAYALRISRQIEGA
jgi:dGTPase